MAATVSKPSCAAASCVDVPITDFTGGEDIDWRSVQLHCRLREFEISQPLRTDSKAEAIMVDVDIEVLGCTNALDLAADVASHILRIKIDEWKRRNLQPIKKKSAKRCVPYMESVRGSRIKKQENPSLPGAYASF